MSPRRSQLSFQAPDQQPAQSDARARTYLKSGQRGHGSETELYDSLVSAKAEDSLLLSRAVPPSSISCRVSLGPRAHPVAALISI